MRPQRKLQPVIEENTSRLKEHSTKRSKILNSSPSPKTSNVKITQDKINVVKKEPVTSFYTLDGLTKV